MLSEPFPGRKSDALSLPILANLPTTTGIKTVFQVPSFILTDTIFFMTLFNDKYRIPSTRLPGWDYRRPGF